MNAEDSSLRARGLVIEFDAHIGLGRIRTEDGDTLLFHCAEIADGSRQIDIDQPVTFAVRRKFENPEAFEIRPQ